MKNRLFEALPVIVFLCIWEGVARLKILPGHALFPPFSIVVIEFYDLSVSGVLGSNFKSSLLRVLAGFISGSLLGILTGTLMGWNKSAGKAFHPILSLLYPIPALGWLPILMLWMGIGEMLPITIIFICSFFPVCYNTITGIRHVPPKIIRVAQTLGASELRILFTVVFPLALPNIFTGLRLEAGMAWRVIIAAEMVAIPTGIGSLLIRAESLIRVEIILVCLIVLSVMCLAFERFFMYLEERVTGKWK